MAKSDVEIIQQMETLINAIDYYREKEDWMQVEYLHGQLSALGWVISK